MTVALASRRLLLLAVLVSGCAAEPAGPAVGAIPFVLTGGDGREGALLFTVAGGPVRWLRTGAGRVFWAPIGRDTVRVLYVGPLRPGTIAESVLPAPRSSYSTTVEQVAQVEGFRPVPVAGYRIVVEP